MAMATDQAFNDGEPDLKNLMEKVLGQLTATDRRNGELLQQIQGRLDVLSDQARASRPGVPSAYRPGFERIEDGMTLLAQRIADTFAARSSAADPHFDCAPAPFQAPALDTVPVSVTPLPASPDAGTATSSPQPLRSSSAGFVAPPRPARHNSNVDTFDVIDSVPGNPAEPWAPDEVAALTQIYDSGDIMPLPADHAQSHADGLAPRQPLPAFEAPVGPHGALDRDWLESRFDEIATRIEHSRKPGSAEQGIAALAYRFDTLEVQLSQALHGLTTAPDRGTLDHIEAHIADLTARLEQVQAEMARFANLEHHLETILHQVSDENLSAVAGRAAPAQGPAEGAGRSDVEFHSVAIAAAEAAAARVAGMASREPQRDAIAGARLDDMHSLLASFIAERRQGEEQNAAVLDSLQHAMVRMLDRMEGVDQGADDTAGMPANHPADSHDQAGGQDHWGELKAPAPLAVPVDELSSSHRLVSSDLGPPLRTDALAPPSDPALSGDPITRQRASLQASAQRAAAAQREKLAASGATPAPDKGLRTPRAAAKAIEAGSSSRLMVSGIVLAITVAIGAGVVSLWMPGDRQVAAAALPANEGQIAQVATTANPMYGVKTIASQPELPRSVPQTVTGDIGELGDVPETDRVPDTAGRPRPDRSAYAKPDPLSGILIQGQPGDANGVHDKPAPGSSAFVNVSASPTDAALATPPDAAAGEQSRAALGLPPATVGPLSLRLAAGNGDPSAEFEVASRLAEGKGTDQNLPLAVRWYQRAATKGFAQAQYRLGTLYERGLGVTKDFGRAKSWYQRAADQGNVKAMHNLAVLAAGRSGQAPDYDGAVKWFTAAAKNGLADSQFNLAVLTESGLGVKKDMVQAEQWYMLAAQSGDRESIRRRDALRGQMNKADIASAEAAVRDWQAQVPDKLVNDATFAGQAWKARQATGQLGNG